MSFSTVSWAAQQTLPPHEKLLLLMAALSSGVPPTYTARDACWAECGMSFEEWEAAMHGLLDRNLLRETETPNLFEIMEVVEKCVASVAEKLPLWIYVVASTDAVKVGITKDVRKRVRSLQTGFPHELEVLFTRQLCNDRCREAERTAHATLADQRLTGEWFDVSGEYAVEVVKGAIEEILA